VRVDLHIHTKYSGHSLLTPEAVVRAAKRRGLDQVAITDHDSIRGALEVSRLHPTIVGEEVSCPEGDVIGLFLTEAVPSGPALEVMDRIRAQGGLVMIPHPFDTLRSEALRSEELCSKGDVIEVFNSRVVRSEDNVRARAFAETRGIAKVVGSDAHTSMEVGRSWLEAEDFDGPKALMAALPKAVLHTRRSPMMVHGQTKLLKFLGR
jgi:predicted metal-dependent phosphoesterase TrpH